MSELIKTPKDARYATKKDIKKYVETGEMTKEEAKVFLQALQNASLRKHKASNMPKHAQQKEIFKRFQVKMLMLARKAKEEAKKVKEQPTQTEEK